METIIPRIKIKQKWTQEGSGMDRREYGCFMLLK